MKPYVLVFMIILCGLILPADTASARRPAKDVKTEKCGATAELNAGPELVMANNIWGLQYVTSGSECIIYPPIGWTWTLGGDYSHVKSYPSIIYGWKPFRGVSTVPGFPAKISAVPKLKVVLAATTTRIGGMYDNAFDIWIVSALPGGVDQIIAEIMLFLSEGNFPNTLPILGTYNVDGVKYNLTEQPMKTWQLYKFWAVPQRLSGTYDIMKFLNILVTAGYLTADDYLADVEFGTEVFNGSGTMTIGTYTIQR